MTIKVLLVDDEPHVLRIMELALRREGYNVVCAPNGQAGLEEVRAGLPDAIIADIEMPKMNGLDMCEQIYREFTDHRMPIFLATSKADSEFRCRAKLLPGLIFLEKPLSVRSLLPILKSRIANRHGSCRLAGG